MRTAGVAGGVELQNFMAATLKVNLFVLLWVALFRGFAGHLIGVKTCVNSVGTLSSRSGKARFS